MAKGQLTVRVLGDTKPFERSVKGIGKTLGTFAKVGAAAFAAAGAAAVTGAFKVAEFGDEIAKTAPKMGITTDALQEMRYWADRNGISAGDLEKAVGRLNTRIGKAAEGNDKYVDAFESLSVPIHDANGEIRETSDVMADAIAALSAIEDPAARAERATELFGQKLGRELAPALVDGALSMEEAAEMAHELGLVMDGEAAAAAEKFQDQWADIKQSVTGVMREALTPLMVLMSERVFPAILDGIGTMRELWKVFQEGDGIVGGLKDVFAELFSGEGGGLFAGILDAARSAIAGLIEWLAGDGFTQIFTFIMESRERLFEAAMTLFPALLDAAIEFLPQLIDWITGTMIPQILDFIVSAVPQLLDAGLELFSSLVDAVIEMLPDLVRTLANDVLPAILKSVLDMIPDLLSAAVDLFTMLVDAVIDILPDLIRTLLGDVLPAVLKAVIQMIPDLLSTAVELFLMLVEAVLDVLPELISILLTEVLPTLLETVIGMIPELLEAAIDLFTALVEAIPVVLPQLVSIIVTDLIPALVTAVLGAIPQLFTAGKDIIRGLWDGISSMGSWIAGKVAGFVSDRIPGPIKRALGISSPSKVAANLAREVPRGMVVGMEAEASKLQDAAERMAAAALPELGVPEFRSGTSRSAAASGGPHSPSVTINVYGDVVTPDANAFVDDMRQMARSR